MTDDRTERRQRNIAKAPIPYCHIYRKKILVFRDEQDYKYGKYIWIPEGNKDNVAPTVTGTVVIVGDAFYQDGKNTCPYEPGDRVVITRYVTHQYSFRVPREWWDRKDPKLIAYMLDVKREDRVPFALVDEDEILADVTMAPEREIWEEGEDDGEGSGKGLGGGDQRTDRSLLDDDGVHGDGSEGHAGDAELPVCSPS